ncbi:erythromycin esterase family protein [Cupriavidus sp. AU9028]|uniref:erythromycin esterase family protein n=1 Tax=Cupriavidus sp. AU9028 TaxID=2871157 RepID=UPI001C955EA4|nr:erythromycin esterase family protein [Cupriavidus sp. AU9028]MBY4896125.1 erythromycin esterase family protein [Cupriavidus sp. AU9028]
MNPSLHEPTSGQAVPESDLIERIASAAERLPAMESSAFGTAVDRFANCRVVLLGEASHGTLEFYEARAALTRHLIEHHGFNIVAVEADWPDAAVLDRYVRQLPAPEHQEPPFRRFPTWMWRNTCVERFIEWMRQYNADRSPEQRASFHGLDIYSLGSSISTVLGYLNDVDPDAAHQARERYGCLLPWRGNPSAYGLAVLSGRARDCEDAVTAQLQALLQKRLDYAGTGHEPFFDAAQNAHLVASAEQYYRLMYRGGPDSWNLRDTHMFDTLARLIEIGRPNARAVVWAHNSHIGNAQATAMGRDHGEVNIGQLCRERFGAQAALIGLSTSGGTVAAASDWDGPMEIKTVVPARSDSYEALFHRTGIDRFLLDLREGQHEDMRTLLTVPRQERFIGVIYRPDTEFASHYAVACLPEQFDALLWFDTTRAVDALPTGMRAGVPDTYPFGV